MTVRELREKYLRFFESKGHLRFPSGSLVPYDVTGRLDESLLFNAAGMVQFKPYFRGIAEPPQRRLATAQKCLRTGDIDETGDLSHLTFFEMMGNFSFGDYFKAQAIAFSWEFITSPEWLGLDPKRVAFTVFEEDDEAYAEWEGWLRSAEIEPSTRIFRLGEDTNYWPAGAFSSGPPGPCGPNTEMFYWTSQNEPAPTGPYSKEDFVRDEAAGKWLEFWNDVFIEFEWQGRPRDPEKPGSGWVKEGMPSLPFRSVDTGMGLERSAAVLSGKRSVYDTDAFAPILAKLSELSGHVYGTDETKDRAMRIVADHVRSAVFCLSDGVTPARTGRGYVLRRLIRRAILKGRRVLGLDQPFFAGLFDPVEAALGDHYRELGERREAIVEAMRSEEALFVATLKAGLERFDDVAWTIYDRLKGPYLQSVRLTGMEPKVEGGSAIEQLKSLRVGISAQLEVEASTLIGDQLKGALEQPFPGEDAFKLYDTFGFPLEVTKELAEEAGLAFDEEGYERAMREAQERSRASAGMDTVYGGVTIQIEFKSATGDKPTPTRFIGYENLESPARIVAALPQVGEDGAPTGDVVFALDQTPFYAESGGQISDEGAVLGDDLELKVLDLFKQDGVFVHLARPVRGMSSPIGLKPEAAAKAVQDDLFGRNVHAIVDAPRRRAIQRNHTATHLLHAALRATLGKHVSQKGSYVGPDRLRFDFSHGKAMTQEEIATVERMVNQHNLENTPVTVYNDLPIDEARARGAMALFGEKYGDRVRMVEIGDFSRELCGGAHVRSLGEIGLFKIVSESSAASGVRRIEAITGEGAYQWALDESHRLRDSAHLLKSSPEGLAHAIGQLQEQLREERKKRERAEASLIQGGAGAESSGPKVVGALSVWAKRFDDVDSKLVASQIDELARVHPNLVALAAIVAGGKVQLVCKVGPDAQAKGAQAGALVGAAAKIVGGGGGGRPDFATAGGKDPSKVDDALAEFERLVSALA